MKTIAYIIPYFGKLPEMFDLWLKSCALNPTIDWLLFTNDKTEHQYPNNVKVTYMTFTELVSKIQSKFPFKILVPSPYRLCDYKVAYGHIFEEELNNYDYWGYCDLDMLWGNIRNFLTDDILNNYEKIGYLGHSTLYKNTEKLKFIYQSPVNQKEIYKDFFTTNSLTNYFFDEKWINIICNAQKIRTYTELIFADIIPWSPKFILSYSKNEQMSKNRHRIFTWENGKLYSKSFYKEKIYTDEFMYIHFLKRRMTLKKGILQAKQLLIIPNIIKEYDKKISKKIIINNSKKFILSYYYNLFIQNKKRITPKQIFKFIHGRYVAKKRFSNKYKQYNII